MSQDVSTKDVAKDQAAEVGQSAVGGGQHVAGVARDEAQNVAHEAVNQAKDVVGQARDQLSQQAAEQQQRAAKGLRSLGQELGDMAGRGEQSGLATDLVQEASGRLHDVAGWLEDRDPSGLLDDVKDFARRRPGVFLAAALGAGLVAGRLTRGVRDETQSPSPARSGPEGSRTTGPVTRATTTTTSAAGPYAAPVPAAMPDPLPEPAEPVGVTPDPRTDLYEGSLSDDDVIVVSPPAGRSTGQEQLP